LNFTLKHKNKINLRFYDLLLKTHIYNYNMENKYIKKHQKIRQMEFEEMIELKEHQQFIREFADIRLKCIEIAASKHNKIGVGAIDDLLKDAMKVNDFLFILATDDKNRWNKYR
jgi:hypothetical protein